jgi:hypothetical protein
VTTWVLVHSPLVGPMTWEPVAGELRRAGVEALVPDVGDSEAPEAPFWRYHAETVAAALATLPASARLVLGGHSGAGPLLPAIAAALGRPVAAYLFVDAGLPADGRRPMGSESFEAYLRELYGSGGRFPSWTEEDLRDVVPDPDVRGRLVAALRPRPWAYWEQPIAVPAGWPDAPCAFLRFAPNPAYDAAAEEARRRGWPTLELPGGHFHLLVAPAAVAAAMGDLAPRAAG